MPRNLLIRYALDLVNNQTITGWAYHRILPSKRLRLRLFGDETELFSTVADLHRQDLINQKVHKDGYCGFSFSLGDGFEPSRYQKLHLYGDGSSPLCSIPTSSIPSVFSGALPKVFFMHIPKTAGTSFNFFAQHRYPQDQIAVHIQGEEPAKHHEILGSKSFVSGHLRLEQILGCEGIGNFDLLTIIRRPYPHLHSHFNWVRGVAAKPGSHFYNQHPACIQELGRELHLGKRRISEILQELVTGLQGFHIDFFDNVQTRYFLDYRPERVGEEDLQRALENFKYFKKIGTTEHYQAFVEDFCTGYGLPFIRQEKAFNRSKHSQLYDRDSDEMKKILAPLVQWDQRLYQAAAKL